MQLIPRKEYLDWLCRWQDKQIIKVVSGVRRCGKSTMFTLFKQNLLKRGEMKNKLSASTLKQWNLKPYGIIILCINI